MRVCTKDFQIPNTKVLIPEGSTIIIPVAAIMKDSDLFPDPEKFDPERFTGANKSKINRNAYIPFGLGPRICPGNNFLFELKSFRPFDFSNFKYKFGLFYRDETGTR